MWYLNPNLFDSLLLLGKEMVKSRGGGAFMRFCAHMRSSSRMLSDLAHSLHSIYDSPLTGHNLKQTKQDKAKQKKSTKDNYEIIFKGVLTQLPFEECSGRGTT